MYYVGLPEDIFGRVFFCFYSKRILNFISSNVVPCYGVVHKMHLLKCNFTNEANAYIM